MSVTGAASSNRVFTEVEQHKSERRAQRAATYAKRFAAKEACAKALGTGLKAGVFWRDIGVVNLPDRTAYDQTHGWRGAAIAPNYASGHERPYALTLTDDFPLAQAIVIISAEAEPARSVAAQG